MLKRFHLERHADISGVSGTGKIAEGCLFVSTGEVVICWLGEHSSINIYHSVADMLHIHGHNGSTELIWENDPEKSEGK